VRNSYRGVSPYAVKENTIVSHRPSVDGPSEDCRYRDGKTDAYIIFEIEINVDVVTEQRDDDCTQDKREDEIADLFTHMIQPLEMAGDTTSPPYF
jgi:hypothetical protein